MKRSLIAALMLLTALPACRKGKYVSEYSYTFRTNAHIDTFFDEQRNKYFYSEQPGGDKIRFTWGWGEDVVGAYDANYGHRLLFQVPQDVTSFSYKDSTLIQALCYYVEMGAWGGYPATGVTKGSIKGRKISDKEWEVEIDVKVPDSAQRTEIRETKRFKREKS